MDDKARAILENYEKDVERWLEKGSHYADIRPLTVNDLLFIRQTLHPTKRAESRSVTETLITLLCERGIITAKEIYEATGLSDKPVLHRLKVFQQFGLVRRESKKYYMPTPRMKELYTKHLKRICS